VNNRLSDFDYAQVLSCVESIYACPSLEEFPQRTLAALRELVQTHLCGYNEVNLVRGRILAIVDPPQPEFAPLVGAFEKLMHEHPVITYFDRTGDGQALKISDFLGAREYHQRAIYRDVYRHMAVEDQIAIGVRLEAGFMVGIALARRSRSFTEKDRLRLNLVRPHLARAYLRVAELAGVLEEKKDFSAALRESGMGVIAVNPTGEMMHATPGAFACLAQYFPALDPKTQVLPDALLSWARKGGSSDSLSSPFVVRQDSAKLTVRRVEGDSRILLLLGEEKDAGQRDHLRSCHLTAREEEILQWITKGKSNSAIAILLGLAPGTVKLHVGHILEKLGVENRTAAALLARGSNP